MQSRRHEDFGCSLRLKDHRGIELSRDPHSMPSHRDILDGPSHHQRHSSPGWGHLHGEQRSGSIERRDYDRGRNETGRLRSRSRSPRFGQVHERLNYGDGPSSRDDMRRKYEFCNYMDRLDDDTSLQRGYDNSRFKENIGNKNAGNRVLEPSLKRDYGHDYNVNNSMGQEDGTGHGRYGLSGDVRPTLNYRDHSGNFGSSSMNVDFGRFKDEGVKYPDSVLLDKSSAIEKYEKGEKHVLSSSNQSHFRDSAFRSKDFSSRPQFKDFGSTSAGLSGSFLGSRKVDMPFPIDTYTGGSAKVMESYPLKEYGKRSTLETRRDPEASHSDLTGYQQDTFYPDRADGQDYLYARPRSRESEYRDYESEGLKRERLLYERKDYDRRDMLTRNLKEPIQDHIDDSEHSLRNFDRSFHDSSSLQNQFSSEYLDSSRLSYTSKHGGRYLDSGSHWVEYERDVLREPEMSSLDISCEKDISQTRSKHDFERDISSLSHRERMRNPSDYQYSSERQQLSAREHGRRLDQIGTYNPRNHSFQKFDVDEEIRSNDFRSTVPSKWKWNNLDRRHDLTDRDEETENEYADDRLLSKALKYDSGRFSRVGKKTFGAETGKVSASEDWSSPYDSAEHVEEYSTIRYKSGGKQTKGQRRPGLLNLYSSQRANKKHYHFKNVWVRGKDDEKVTTHASDVEETEHWLSAEPPENSEEFMQLVHGYFLSFTKKINDSPSARKRYKEQGRAGSLFCIVCSRSQSKVFMDTRNLATHCYMSHKFGLRAQHLGLHRAICVLLGWDTKTAADVTTWTPVVISSSEALAQKADLMLWPPIVIIHNISMLHKSSAGKEVITVEAVEDFLRGKGFSGGTMKVLRQGNNIITLVKFLGTFTGLQDADKLNKYFAENKHGRADFEKLSSLEGKSIKSDKAKAPEVKLDELVLYGYMGIAEDLDKVDVDTKRKCSVKSYKEILDFANAPV